MKRLLELFICFIFCSTLNGQGNIMYDRFFTESLSPYFHIFGDKVNIRSAPDKNSEVLKQITIGDSIKIVKVTDIEMEMNGMIYPWVEVEWTSNKQKKMGYVWGALFAFYHEKYKTDDGLEYALYLGPLKYDADNKKLLGEARLCSNGNIIDNGSFLLHQWDAAKQCFLMGIYKNSYRNIPSVYRNIEYILSVGITVESCGPSGTIYVLINKGQIIFSGSELGSFSGGDFAEGNEFVFPWDKGGMKEQIFEYYSLYMENEDANLTEDTTYLINTYTKIDGEFKLSKKHVKN
jgi:hypothetical protein